MNLTDTLSEIESARRNSQHRRACGLAGDEVERDGATHHSVTHCTDGLRFAAIIHD